MKKTKIIIPALGMLLLSTAASVTGTVAWFSMNSFVNATQMNIKARAENGIVISNEAKSLWKETAEASHQTALSLYPTSTLNGDTWCHSTSNNANSALNTDNVPQPYSMLNPELDTTYGAGFVESNNQQGYQHAKGTTTDQTPVSYEADSTYYLLNSFFIKSSAEELTKTIYVTDVSVTGVVTTTGGSAELDKSLRVLIRTGVSTTPASFGCLVYAPVDGATLEYESCTAVNNNVATKEGVTAIYPNAAASTTDSNPGKDKALLSDYTIPGFSSTSPLQIDVYVYFEGEDENCKSANLVTTLDSLNVSVRFGTERQYSHAAPTQNP